MCRGVFIVGECWLFLFFGVFVGLPGFFGGVFGYCYCLGCPLGLGDGLGWVPILGVWGCCFCMGGCFWFWGAHFVYGGGFGVVEVCLL